MIDAFLSNFMQSLPAGGLGFFYLFIIIALSLLILGKGADILVDKAVVLSIRWGIPKMIIGATIVSLGTTLPEVTVSVMSALKGAPGLALGNAVGSVICDTGLILGLATLVSPLPFKKEIVNTQGWIQFNAGLLLVIVSLIFSGGKNVFLFGGKIPQFIGFVFLALLVIYLVHTIKSSQNMAIQDTDEQSDNMALWLIILQMFGGIILVISSSKILLPAVEQTAIRLNIPQTIIAATLVAFGTSLPELITALTSAKKGHGDLAIGNIIGADILNILFVIGLSTAVTRQGLFVDINFFTVLFPAMLFVLVVFRSAIIFSKESIKWPFGIVLLLSYVAV
ncbi:MAG: sodium:calcium antiporter, partial [Treponemataceae bacterium]